MKNLLLLAMLVTSTSACAMGSKRPQYDENMERDPSEKIYFPCRITEDPKPEAKACNQVCVKRATISKKCEEFKVNKLDMNDPVTWKFMIDSGIIFANKKYILD